MYVPDPNNDAVDVISATTHSFTPVRTTVHCSPLSIVAGKNNDMWFTESGCNSIGHLTISTKKIDEYKNHIGGGNPNRIVMDANGNLWFTDTGADLRG